MGSTNILSQGGDSGSAAGGGGTVTGGGTGIANRIAYWTGASSIAPSVFAMFDEVNHVLLLDVAAKVGSETLRVGGITQMDSHVIFKVNGPAVTASNFEFGVNIAQVFQFNAPNGTGYSIGINNVETIGSRQSSPLTVTQAARVGNGQASLITATGGAHTNLQASTEKQDISFALARTVQFSTGDITTQRATYITAPTYAFVGASTITNAATLALSGAPIAGTNATITNSRTLNIESGTIGMNDAIQFNTGVATVASSYSISQSITNNLQLNAASGFRIAFSINGSSVAAISSTRFLSNGGIAGSYVATATDYTVTTSDYIIGVTSTAAPRTITLPVAVTTIGSTVTIKDESGGAGTNNITISVASGTLDGAASKVINTNYGSIDVYSNGTNWFIK